MMLNAELPLTKKKFTCANFFFFKKDHLRKIRHPYFLNTRLCVPFFPKKKSKIADCTFDHLRKIRHPYFLNNALRVPFCTKKNDHFRRSSHRLPMKKKIAKWNFPLKPHTCFWFSTLRVPFLPKKIDLFLPPKNITR